MNLFYVQEENNNDQARVEDQVGLGIQTIAFNGVDISSPDCFFFLSIKKNFHILGIGV